MKTIRANPVKMDSILREVEVLKAARRAKKEAKRAKKEAKREAKRHKRGRSSSTSSSSDERGGGRSGGAGAGVPHAPPSHSTAAHQRSARCSRSRSRSPRRRLPVRSQGHHERHDVRRGDGRSHASRRSPSPPPRRRSRERRSRSHERAAPAPAPVPVFAADGACAQVRDAGYGLTFASAEAEAAARANAAAAGSRPEYTAAKAPQPEAPASWQRGHNSVRHTAGRLTEEERASRLAAMSANADLHEEERWQRLRREAARDAADQSTVQHAPAHHHSEKPAFLDQKERELFGAGAAAADALADRVGARKHFQQRGMDAAGNAFRR